uniref:Lymphocyte antigen 6 complex locus G6E n=1 Tax=Mus musculus TaxID=10090 RepID=A0A1L6ZAB8_MOUSE|nr:lymphocyte antigen 6 complex locus G6E [Mus musculus]
MGPSSAFLGVLFLSGTLGPNLPLMTLLPLAAMIGWGVHDFL